MYCIKYGESEAADKSMDGHIRGHIIDWVWICHKGRFSILF